MMKLSAQQAEGVPASYIRHTPPRRAQSFRKQAQDALQRAIAKGETDIIAEKYNLPEGVFLPEATIDQGKG